jgi:hypothetical protein
MERDEQNTSGIFDENEVKKHVDSFFAELEPQLDTLFQGFLYMRYFEKNPSIVQMLSLLSSYFSTHQGKLVEPLKQNFNKYVQDGFAPIMPLAKYVELTSQKDSPSGENNDENNDLNSGGDQPY